MWIRRIRYWLRSGQREASLRAEMEAHLEERTAELREEGLREADARSRARREFGNFGAKQEESREIWIARCWWDFWQDLRYGVRQLAKSPGFTAVAVLSLALGIGANTTIFSLGSAMLLRPLPTEEPERLVSVFTSYAGGERYGQTSHPDYEDFRDRTDLFSGLAAFGFSPVGLKAGERTEIVMGQVVTWNYFSVLGVEPILGRDFLPEEDQTLDTHPVAILSHRIWKSRFGSHPEVLGQTVLINDHPFTIVGVAPEGFHGSISILAPDVWVPLMMANRALAWVQRFGPGRRRDPFLFVVGRLQSGVGIEQAQAAMDVLAANLERQYPYHNKGKTVTLVEAGRARLGFGTTDSIKPVFALLMGVVILVLAIACFNVANVLLAKAAGRQREIVLRISLGASRLRVVRQLLTEGVMLSLAAGFTGVLIAVWSLDLLSNMLRSISEFPIEIDVRLDHRVLGFTLLLSLVAGTLSGLAPALQVVRAGQLASLLKEQALSVTRSKGGARMQNGFVIAQVALSLILLISTGLFLRSIRKTLAVDPGFDPNNRLALPINLNYGQYEEAEGRLFYRQLAERVRALPGVRQAALSAFLPLAESHGRHDVWIDGYDPAPDESMLVRRNMVGPEYFETLGIPLLSGRAINKWDREDTKPVAVINKAMARRYWPGRDPIGRTIHVGDTVHEVVGIAQDGKYEDLREESAPYLCLPMTQHEYSERFHLVVRTSGDPRAMMAVVRDELIRLHPNLPAPKITTLAEFVGEAAQRGEGPSMFVGISGLLALFLALIGIYGTTSYSVSQRTREIGVRMALGARQGEILGHVIRGALRITLMGVGIGLVGAIAMTRLWSAYLFGVTPQDPLTFAGVSVMMILVALAACYLPARRAARTDPMAVLRYE
jgi:macrolide transport system ATP-binding/permease protein